MTRTEEDPIDIPTEVFPNAFGPNASPQANPTIPPVELLLQTPSDLATAAVSDKLSSSKDPCRHFLQKLAKLKLALWLVISPPKQTVLPPAPLPFPCFADIPLSLT